MLTEGMSVYNVLCYSCTSNSKLILTGIQGNSRLFIVAQYGWSTAVHKLYEKEILKKKIGWNNSLPVMMESIRCPETSVNNYHTTPCNNPEDHSFKKTGDIQKGMSFPKSNSNQQKCDAVTQITFQFSSFRQQCLLVRIYQYIQVTCLPSEASVKSGELEGCTGP
jgi:hypothetical protein